MQKEMSTLNQNIVNALSYAMTGIESCQAWLADGKNVPRMAYHEVFEEMLMTLQKSRDKLRGLIEGHVKMDQW